MKNLLGDTPPQELLDEVNCAEHVTENTPPCFLWHTGEDAGVPLENSMVFASALRENGVPFELHSYNKGRHGLGLVNDVDGAPDCLRWIDETVTPEEKPEG